MSVELTDLRLEIQQRLGDSSAAIWTAAELEDYIQEGYDNLTRRTGCLLGVVLLPDRPASFNFTYEWERASAESHAGQYCDGPFNFTYEWERDDSDNGRGPANHNYPWEFTESYFAPSTEIPAVVDLPDDLQEIERATWNTKRCEAFRSRDVEVEDSRYELNKGQVEAVIQDKDGLDRLRKWRVPSAAYVPYSFDSSSDDGFGIIRDLSGIVTTTVVSTETDGYGDLVQVDGVDVFEDFGILGPIYKETNDLRIEYRRRGLTLTADQGDLMPGQHFEIPDRYTVYVRHYVMARALRREGSGQELKLAGHFEERYEAGIARMLKRKAAIEYQRKFVLGGAASIRGHKPPRPQLPWAYGKVVR